MHAHEERMRAVALYVKLGKRLRATIRELGYPTGSVAEVRHCPDAPLSPFSSCHAFDLGSAECIEAVHECYADLELGSLTLRIT
jgi:hypothetical protein